jgi:hypothetical protein
MVAPGAMVSSSCSPLSLVQRTKGCRIARAAATFRWSSLALSSAPRRPRATDGGSRSCSRRGWWRLAAVAVVVDDGHGQSDAEQPDRDGTRVVCCGLASCVVEIDR